MTFVWFALGAVLAFLVIYLVLRRVVRKVFWVLLALGLLYVLFHVFVRVTYYPGEIPQFLHDSLKVVEFPFLLAHQVMGDSFAFFDEVLSDVVRRY